MEHPLELDVLSEQCPNLVRCYDKQSSTVIHVMLGAVQCSAVQWSEVHPNVVKQPCQAESDALWGVEWGQALLDVLLQAIQVTVLLQGIQVTVLLQAIQVTVLLQAIHVTALLQVIQVTVLIQGIQLTVLLQVIQVTVLLKDILVFYYIKCIPFLPVNSPQLANECARPHVEHIYFHWKS